VEPIETESTILPVPQVLDALLLAKNIAGKIWVKLNKLNENATDLVATLVNGSWFQPDNVCLNQTTDKRHSRLLIYSYFFKTNKNLTLYVLNQVNIIPQYIVQFILKK